MAGDLKAVAPKAQRKVKPPVELDLTTPIYTPTQADWEALGVTGGGGNSGPASRPQSRAAAATPPPQQQDASPAVEVSAERPPPKPRPGAVGPYYLPCGALVEGGRRTAVSRGCCFIVAAFTAAAAAAAFE